MSVILYNNETMCMNNWPIFNALPKSNSFPDFPVPQNDPSSSTPLKLQDIKAFKLDSNTNLQRESGLEKLKTISDLKSPESISTFNRNASLDMIAFAAGMLVLVKIFKMFLKGGLRL